jgi:hypothetical protein
MKESRGFFGLKPPPSLPFQGNSKTPVLLVPLVWHEPQISFDCLASRVSGFISLLAP